MIHGRRDTIRDVKQTEKSAEQKAFGEIIFLQESKAIKFCSKQRKKINIFAVLRHSGSLSAYHMEEDDKIKIRI